jgi:hypothetical protein
MARVPDRIAKEYARERPKSRENHTIVNNCKCDTCGFLKVDWQAPEEMVLSQNKTVSRMWCQIGRLLKRLAGRSQEFVAANVVALELAVKGGTADTEHFAG